MKAAHLIRDALSDWRVVRNAPDLAHDLFDGLDEDELQRLALRALTDEVRAALRRKIDGVPVYSNVTVADATTGEMVQQYKQTEAFSADDYRVAIDSYARRAHAEIRVAIALRNECRERHGIQIAIPGLDVAA